ncbi:MAG: cytochrome c peroxidase [Flavobacteriales bacterium]
MKMFRHAMIWPLLAGLLLAGCTRDPVEFPHADGSLFELHVPPGWPEPPLRADNPLTVASVKLGKALFFDERLSLDRGISCASCHHPDRAFSDTVALSIGVHGGVGMRNSPSLANVAYHPLLMRDGGAPTLEQQVFIPIMDEAEMDADPQLVLESLCDDPVLTTMSMQAYGKPLDLYVLTRALANYQRTLLSGTSRYDRFLQGDATALDDAEVRGMQVFNGAAQCSVCHAGFDLSDHDFHNVGLALDHTADAGRQRVTLNPADRGKFKTPTLRNIALTAPYMHDGSMATLEETIEHFNSGGLADPNKDPLITPLQLSPDQKQDLASFLRSLTDERSLDVVE